MCSLHVHLLSPRIRAMQSLIAAGEWQEELRAMLLLADADSHVFLRAGRKVAVTMADFFVGDGAHRRCLGRRPIEVRPYSKETYNQKRRAKLKRPLIMRK